MYYRLLFLLGCWLALAGEPRLAHAQTPVGSGEGVVVPNAPGLASPPLPPDTTRKAPAARAPRKLPGRPRALVWVGTPADQALVRRLHPPAAVRDSLTALRTVRELVLALQAESYLLASADTVRWGRDTVRVGVYAGEPFRWAYLHNGNLGDGLLTRAGYREKFFRHTPWRAADWVTLQERILTEAENQGYPFATVGLDSVRIETNAIAGRVVLRRGPAILFDSLQIVGTSRTKKRFLTKYLQLFPGAPYSQARVQSAAALLRQLPYVRLRAEPEVRFARGRARVYLLLDERPANQFDAIVGLLPNTVGGGVQFTGDVTIALRNLRGGGKQVGLQWRKVDAASQTLDVNYLHPNFFGTPLEVAGTFNLYRQNLAFLTIKPRVQLTYPTARAGRLTFFAELRSSRLLLDSLSYVNLSALPEYVDSETNNYGLAYSRAYLDDLFFPHRGSFVSIQGGVGTRSVRRNIFIQEKFYTDANVQPHSTQYSFSGRAEHYWALGRQGVVVARLRGEGLFNQQQQYFLNDLFRLGGLNSLRGFSENQFYTNAYGVGTVEFRQFTGPEGYVFLFADQALLRASQLDSAGTGLLTALDAPTGLGAGLSFRTAAGLFQFVYSVGRSQFYGQSFGLSNSKIHFGLTSRF